MEKQEKTTEQTMDSQKGKLNILWTTANKETVINMIAMYSSTSLKYEWWSEVNVIIWGASAKLIKEDVEIQKVVLEMINNGVNVGACLACADKYDATETLKNMGIDVKYMGQPLTDIIKKGEKLITL
tara:strand:- start:12942 stop:13322 length:381 start_codon:yes stop_codon:yes gene_type:complete